MPRAWGRSAWDRSASISGSLWRVSCWGKCSSPEMARPRTGCATPGGAVVECLLRYTGWCIGAVLIASRVGRAHTCSQVKTWSRSPSAPEEMFFSWFGA